MQDGSSFLHIAAWKAGKSNIFSTTLISGACLAPDATAYADFADAMAAAAVDGCNVRAVNNVSLIPTLLNYGSLPTPESLLVLIAANVSLGFGLSSGAIPIHRPVVMVGAYSVPTSIDMYMVVNQLNVTSKQLLSLVVSTHGSAQQCVTSCCCVFSCMKAFVEVWGSTCHKCHCRCADPQQDRPTVLAALVQQPWHDCFLTDCCCCRQVRQDSLLVAVHRERCTGGCNQQSGVTPYELSSVCECVCSLL